MIDFKTGTDKAFKLEVQRGNVPGVTIVHLFGERESMDTNAAGEDIWRVNELSATPSAPASIYITPTPASAGEQMTVISESAGDVNGSTGIDTLELDYLDGSGDEQTTTVTMNGTTAVDVTPSDVSFVNGMHATAVGTGTVATGNIRIYKKADDTLVYSMIAAGGNQSMVPIYKVPTGKTLYTQGWHAEEAQSKRVAFRIRSTDKHGSLLAGVFCFKDVAYLNGGTSGPLPLDAAIPAASIIKVSGWPDAINAEGSCGFWGYLVTN